MSSSPTKSSASEVFSLAEPFPFSHRLEITINHPRTKPFCRMSLSRQRSLYYSSYLSVLHTYKDIRYEDSYRYEECQDGHLHFHAYIDLKMPKVFIPEGLVMEATKAIIFSLPKRTHLQLTQFRYCERFETWRSPACCIRITPVTNTQRISDWVEYINKNVKVT